MLSVGPFKVALNSVKWFCSKGKCTLLWKYVRYHFKTYTTMWIILTTMKEAKFQISSTIITESKLYHYIIHWSADVH